MEVELFRKQYPNLILLTSILSTILFIFGCPKKPPIESVDVNKSLKSAIENCAHTFAPEELKEIDYMIQEMNILVEKRKFKQVRKKALEIIPQLKILSATILREKEHLKSSIELEKKKAEKAIAVAEDEGALQYSPELIMKAKALFKKASLHMEVSDCNFPESLSHFQNSIRIAEKASSLAMEETIMLLKKEEERKHQEEQMSKKEKKLRESITLWKVSKGENLWIISSKKEVFDNPLLWPLIYWANRSQIKDPNLIYKNQILKIPRNFQKDDIEKAIRTATSEAKSMEYN